VSDYGQDSITMLGKFVVMCTSNRIQALPVTALFGSAVDVAGTKLVLPERIRRLTFFICLMVG